MSLRYGDDGASKAIFRAGLNAGSARTGRGSGPMRRQEDLDKYNDDLQWERFADRLLWALCIIVILLTAAYIYRSLQVRELVRLMGRM